ncbi:MAG TPA: protein kinase [Pirellulales bacterium]|nr:protein kinase [Pirellulales bacterium]
MNLRATQAEPEPQPRSGPMKFTYASGSRPLDGFTIKRGIGRGGFGEVYYATSDAGKEVALKLIRRNLDIELRGVTQCLNLKHPNLVGLFDIKQDELGDSWVVMEFVSGDCLEQVVSRHPNGMPRDEALAWFHGIAAGVSYLHDHGIVHRDLKPGNIFCDEGLIKIGDYGLSKFISASRRSGQTESVGTVHYMAPEIGNGRYGKEIDIYALGIILYEMLTGHVPFEGESVGEVLMKHLTAEPDLSGVEEPYRSAIARTLTKSPEGRVQTVAELIALLPAATRGPVATAPTHFANPLPAAAPASVGEPEASASGWPRNAAASCNQGADAPRSPRAGGAAAALGTADNKVVSDVVLVDEEPIARAVREHWRKFRDAWNSGRISAPGRVAILGVTIYSVISLNVLLLPIALWCLFAYCAYYAVRSIVLALRHPSAIYPPRPLVARPAVAASPARPAAASPPPMPSPRAAAVIELPPKSLREKLQELTGSMLVSAAVAAVMGVLLGVLRGKAAAPEQFVWLVLVGTVGAWAVMLPTKFWERGDGEALLRRCLLLLLGLGLGAFAFASKRWLLVDLPYEWRAVQIGGRLSPQSLANFEFTDLSGAPTLMGHMAFFAFLLVALRWWRQADPTRPHRLSLWSTSVSVFAAWLLCYFWPFPQPWSLMVAATISVAVQLASPWQGHRRRRARAAAA